MEQRLTATLSQEFDTTFFRKGIDMVRYGMETMTQAEQNAIIEYCEKEKFTKNIGDDGRIIYTKGYEEYAIKHFDLDIESKKLREKMQIDKWKKQLDDVRKTDQKKEIEQTEINATNAILQALRHYPYQLTKNNNGYQVSKILSTKELYCVGYALL
ncbi:MAG: hypothetical protein LBP53_07825 [Candidatus Peribacteria bacterium]|jgi:hypothetical protein|nr:hypothetical protein [Candidatus Peribacteria bacterium]